MSTICVNNASVKTDNSMVCGNNCTITGSGNTIIGNNNTIHGHNNSITGNNNSIWGDENVIKAGNNNEIEGAYNVVKVGNNNELWGYCNVAESGNNNEVIDQFCDGDDNVYDFPEPKRKPINGNPRQDKNMSYREQKEQEQLLLLYDEMKDKGFKKVDQVNEYVIKHNLKEKYSYITGTLVFHDRDCYERTWVLEGALQPKYYAEICKRLGLSDRRTFTQYDLFTAYADIDE